MSDRRWFNGMSWDFGGSFALGSWLDSLVSVISGPVSEASSWTDMVVKV